MGIRVIPFPSRFFPVSIQNPTMYLILVPFPWNSHSCWEWIPITIGNAIPMITCSANPIRRVWPDKSVLSSICFGFGWTQTAQNKQPDINLLFTCVQFKRCSCPTVLCVYLQPIFCAHIPSFPPFSFVFYAISGRTLNGFMHILFSVHFFLVSSSLSILIILFSCN